MYTLRIRVGCREHIRQQISPHALARAIDLICEHAEDLRYSGSVAVLLDMPNGTTRILARG